MTEGNRDLHSGGCLCGAVRYEVRGPLRREVNACHCRICRRFTGGLWAGTAAWRKDVSIEDDDALTWYQSSPHARRGFCGRCGSGLFWEGTGDPDLVIAASSLDEPSGLRLTMHSMTVEAADFWDFSDEILLKEGPSGLEMPDGH